MIDDGDSAAIVHAILSLAKALGMETTAEGIESEELAHGLAELGCTYGQGFYFSEAAARRRGARLLAGAQRLIDVAPGQRADLLRVARKAGRRPVPLDRLQRRRHHRPRLQPHRDQVAAADREPRPLPAVRAPRDRATAAPCQQEAVDRLGGADPVGERLGRIERPLRRRDEPLAPPASTAAAAPPPRRPPPDRPAAGPPAAAPARARSPPRARPRPGRRGASRRSISGSTGLKMPRAIISAHGRRRIGQAEQLQQLVGDPLARQRHQIVGPRRAGVERRRVGRALRRSGRGSGRSAGCADDPRRCAAAARR